MAYIRSFTIEGLAGRKDVCSLQLNEYVNVCFGPNGCGKTSLLRILHSVLSNDAALVKEVPFTKAQVTVYSYATKTDFVYSLDKTIKSAPESKTVGTLARTPRTRTRAVWQVDPEPRHWYHKYLPISRLYTSMVAPQVNYFEPPSMSEESLEAQFAQNLAQVWKDYSTAVTREVNEAQEAGLARILQAVISRSESSPDEGSGDPSDAYHSVENFLARRRMDFPLSKEEFLRRYKSEPQLRSVAKDIEAVELKIAQVTLPRDDFKRLTNEMFFGGKLLGFSDKGEIQVSSDNQNISLATLSSGEKHLLRIFVDTLAAGASIILVDEPELSMHVEWQQRLVSSLKIVNPAAQMIFATHSPEIMANLPDEQIFRLWHG